MSIIIHPILSTKVTAHIIKLYCHNETSQTLYPPLPVLIFFKRTLPPGRFLFICFFIDSMSVPLSGLSHVLFTLPQHLAQSFVCIRCFWINKSTGSSDSKAPHGFLSPRRPRRQQSTRLYRRKTVWDELTAVAFPPTCMQRNWNQDQLESNSVDLNGKNILKF